MAGRPAQTKQSLEEHPSANASASGGLHEKLDFDEAGSRGLVLWRCTFVPSPQLHERGININAVRERLSRAGEILQSTPKVRGQGSVAFEFIVGMRETPPDITEWEKDGISIELMEQAAPNAIKPAPGGTPDETADNLPGAHNLFIAPSHVVRVDLNKLDELMRITGELVIHRSRLDEHLARADRRTGSLDPRTLNEVNSRFARSLRELRESIMRIRLVPVAEIFARMPFVVRDLARESDKQVRLSLEGQQTELDKYLIERLKDPLLHLVRNAFSHSAETPEVRRQAGKAAETTITLSAFTRGDSVILQVTDDGRGIDAQAVARRARAQGMQVPEKIDNPALLKILCSPGFSTREDADRASGRGVGMAVVNNTVRELGGTITLETELGRGTRFTLSLPLTLAIAETLIISAGGQTCAIPQSYVAELIQVQATEIRVVNNVEVVPYRSGVLPISRLGSMFQLPPSDEAQLSMLVLSSDRGCVGLVVDRIHGQREVVVRALRDPLLQVPGISGATELGDGRPVLILDGGSLSGGAVRPLVVERKEFGK
jgi:two-component system chemotaxis sensor kinase CheA